MSDRVADELRRAAEAIASRDRLLIGAGAGIGVDSGLPDFRGPQGFWREYPPYEHLGLSFVDLANPRWFDSDPEFAWGFYGHRQNLYRDTRPHAGFELLSGWGAERFVFTSNVDGHFQMAGFDEAQVFEVHGSIHWLQCARTCTREIWPAERTRVAVDPQTFRAAPPLPRCPRCGEVSRPNILMFGDWGFLGDRSDDQQRRFDRWLAAADPERLVIVEIGAGTAVPTVRFMSERLAAAGAALIRINPREAHGPPGTIGLPMAGLEALSRIQELL